MSVTYPVPCECGAVLHVPGTAAGTTPTCTCGRAVQVPSLARLKSAAGEAALSADLELQYLIQARALPPEHDCVMCWNRTDGTMAIHVVCEQSGVKGKLPLWQHVLLICLSLWVPFLHAVAAVGDEGEPIHGRNVQFRLPVRVCEHCRPQVYGQTVLREALCRTPVYQRLLDKYPHATIAAV